MFANDLLERREIAGAKRCNQLGIVVFVRLVPCRGSRPIHALRLPQRPQAAASPGDV